MQLLLPDARLADLVQLDVLDVRLDGSYALNADFAAACRAAFAADPSRFDEIIPDMILARAMARGLADGIDLDGLVEATLDYGVAEADA